LTFTGVLTPTNGFTRGLQFPLKEPASLLDYWGFLATSGKTQLAWGFRNPRYCLGFSKPLLLLGVSETPDIAKGLQNPATTRGFQNPCYCQRFSKPMPLPGVSKTSATARCF